MKLSTKITRKKIVVGLILVMAIAAGLGFWFVRTNTNDTVRPVDFREQRKAPPTAKRTTCDQIPKSDIVGGEADNYTYIHERKPESAGVIGGLMVCEYTKDTTRIIVTIYPSNVVGVKGAKEGPLTAVNSVLAETTAHIVVVSVMKDGVFDKKTSVEIVNQLRKEL